MQIGNRHFPYPVLNHNKAYSNYIDSCDFKMHFTKNEANAIPIEQGELILKDLCFILNEPGLDHLVDEGKIGGYLIVECSASVFREKYPISKTPKDLHIPATSFNDRVEFSCYLYALEDIKNYNNINFDPFFGNFSFDLEKYDVVAIDDGFRMRIEIDPSQDDKVSSIFTIVKAQTDSLTAKTTYSEKGITIALPAAVFDAYETIKMKKEFNNIAFSMIAIPALVSCLKELKTYNYSSIDEIVEYNRWFLAICKSYYSKTGNQLDIELFESLDMYEVAQIVLNDATGNGMLDFSKLLMGQEEEDDE